MTFEEKVRSMTAKEIIMAMVNALTHPPIINIRMSTFGEYEIKKEKYFFGLLTRKKKICFGCAATNTICKISEKTFTDVEIDSIGSRAEFINSDGEFLYMFEHAINQLRLGNISNYNDYADLAGFAKITREMDFMLPRLSDNYTNEDLEPYKKLAELQPA